jgi:hypothetical protein
LVCRARCRFVAAAGRDARCAGSMGDSFAAGTTDGPGDFNFEQGTNSSSTNPLCVAAPFPVQVLDCRGLRSWNLIGHFLANPPADQVACQVQCRTARAPPAGKFANREGSARTGAQAHPVVHGRDRQAHALDRALPAHPGRRCCTARSVGRRVCTVSDSANRQPLPSRRARRVHHDGRPPPGAGARAATVG